MIGGGGERREERGVGAEEEEEEEEKEERERGEDRAQSHIRPVSMRAKFEISLLYLPSFMPETQHNHHVSYIKMCRLYISHYMHVP